MFSKRCLRFGHQGNLFPSSSPFIMGDRKGTTSTPFTSKSDGKKSLCNILYNNIMCIQQYHSLPRSFSLFFLVIILLARAADGSPSEKRNIYMYVISYRPHFSHSPLLFLRPAIREYFLIFLSLEIRRILLYIKPAHTIYYIYFELSFKIIFFFSFSRLQR